MRLIRRACSAVLVSIAMIGTSGCGHSVHVHFNNGQTKVHVGGSQDRTAGAQRDSAERERLWKLATKLYSGYQDYQARAASRRIPVMVLDPVSDP